MPEATIQRADVGRGVEIAYETFGSESDPPLVLVMGLATQMLGWPEPFCHALAEAGHRVVRFDNRDIGLSTHMTEAPVPDVAAALGGDFATASYTLSDMAADTAGLLDVLGIGSAHVVGASMGGMIAQTIAIEHPSRVRTLTSIMATPSPRIGPPTQEAAAVLLKAPAQDREGVIESVVETYRVIGSPGFDFDEAALRERAGLSFDRSHDPLGVARQLVAIQASGDRTEALGTLDLPALVIHGAGDPLVQVEGGRATAAAIPGAELAVIDGMGHDLPRDLWPTLVERITGLTGAADQA